MTEISLVDATIPVSMDYLEFIEAYCKEEYGDDCAGCPEEIKRQCGPLFAESVCETMIMSINFSLSMRGKK